MRKRKMRKRRRRKRINFFLGLPWGHICNPDPPGLEAACPSSQPQDLRVKRGEGGPLPQVIWRHLTWSSANPRPSVLVPDSRPSKNAVQSGIAGAFSPEPTSSPPQDRPPWRPPRPRHRWSPLPGALLFPSPSPQEGGEQGTLSDHVAGADLCWVSWEVFHLGPR